MGHGTWHIITCEYPPQAGGVSDYTRLVASGLAAMGDKVHVWCPPCEGAMLVAPGVAVHPELGQMSPADLRRAGTLLDEFTAPRRLIVQWVPHGYGYRSMNLPFCWWLWQRASRYGDRVELMVHEPYLPFKFGALKQNGAAAVHRLMTILLLRAASHVWVSVPAWEKRLRPYALGRKLRFQWLPVVSNIPTVDDPAGVAEIRTRYAPRQGFLVGHFGAYDQNLKRLLLAALPFLLREKTPEIRLLLLGRGSEVMCDELLAERGDLKGRIAATGALAAPELSKHLSACDVLVQPYIDGVSSRRGGLMAGLAHGLPIVTTQGVHTEPIWHKSRAVVLAPAGDGASLAEETRRILLDAKRRSVLSAAARSLYEKHFTVSHVVAMLRAGGAHTMTAHS
jgi:glycosyltransferase involved in cell wall biosynthesis